MSRAPLRAAAQAAVLAALLLTAAGCERAPPAAAGAPPGAADPLDVAVLPAAPTPPNGAALPAASSDAAPTIAAAGFDVGAIKTAAEYLAEPQFAAADAARGKLLSFACAACHAFGAGEKPIVGPNLYGVFGRTAGAAPGFMYTQALRESGLIWTPRAVEAWLAEPARFVPGTSMAFTGYKSPEDRRDLLAYLLQVTSNHP